jgi:hypothetical protein
VELHGEVSAGLAAGEITKAKRPNTKQTEQIEQEDPRRAAMLKLEFCLFLPDLRGVWRFGVCDLPRSCGLTSRARCLIKAHHR